MGTMPTKNDNQEVLDAISDLALATGKGFEDVRKELGGLRSDVADVRDRMAKIEAYILADHARRIEALERQIASR